jgi:serine/threonine-protein kinase HipA
MRRARVYNYGTPAGVLIEADNGSFVFEYDEAYHGEPVSWSMPIKQRRYEFNEFPAFFDGLLPEGIMLAALLKQAKIDEKDYFLQLITVGKDLVGSVTIGALDD